jgi:hypothetical protein
LIRIAIHKDNARHDSAKWMRRMIRSLPALGAISLALILFHPLRTPGQNPTGAARGTVQDSSGARIASARIEIHLLAAALTRDALADNRGEFRIDLLPSGQYKIT